MPGSLRCYSGVWGFAAILLSAMLACGCSGGSDDNWARTMCREFVQDRLKAPSTASISIWGQTAYKRENGHYMVTGPVDAENSFGAMLRMTYHCETHRIDAETWALDSLSFD